MTSEHPLDTTALDSIAGFYDLDVQGYEDDIELYLALAEEFGGPILDLGCGTGRVARELAGAGFEVTAVDVSPGMLAVARGRSATAPATPSIDWVPADMRTLDLGRRFSLVVAPLGALQHLEQLDDVVATFEVIARHLAVGGAAVIDVEAPGAEDFEGGPQPLVEHWTRPWRDGQVTKWVSVVGVPSLGLREVTWHFDEQLREGGLRRHTATFPMRTFTLAELELAGRLVGLQVTAAHGDYDGSPYADDAQRLVVTFEHAEAQDSHSRRPEEEP